MWLFSEKLFTGKSKISLVRDLYIANNIPKPINYLPENKMNYGLYIV
jgi:hypothetical protein